MGLKEVGAVVGHSLRTGEPWRQREEAEGTRVRSYPVFDL